MMTYKDIDRIVSQVTGISIKRIHSDRDKIAVCDARNLAMYFCKHHLKLSTLKLKKIYGKDSHTTIMSDIKSAENLIETEPASQERAFLIESKIRCREKQLIKSRELYNLHYRIRLKGFSIDMKSKTVSVSPDKKESLENSQFEKLLTRHGYYIQYSLI
jgi:hypothetical protein